MSLVQTDQDTSGTIVITAMAQNALLSAESVSGSSLCRSFTLLKINFVTLVGHENKCVQNLPFFLLNQDMLRQKMFLFITSTSPPEKNKCSGERLTSSFI